MDIGEKVQCHKRYDNFTKLMYNKINFNIAWVFIIIKWLNLIKNIKIWFYISEIDEIRKEIRSKLWFTYRKGFVPIGGFGSNITSDKGWGCMLRCGQMVLGQALISLHLGKHKKLQHLYF